MSKLLQAVEMTPEIVIELKQRQSQVPPDRMPVCEGRDVLLPSLGEWAFHGLVGEFVKALSPHTEADPAALLLQTLVTFGAAAGRGPHIILDGSRHQPNEYAVIVGASGKGRKGTSWARIKSVFDFADPEFATHRIKTGLSSGEGLIFQVRDPIESFDIKNGTLVICDPGVEDKRLLAMEPEFASVLKVLERDGNLLSPILRSAWDGGKLSPLTKSHPIEATDSHISLIGHITEEELVHRLTETEAANGFGNRILWVFSRRARLLPFGGQFGSDKIEEFGRRFRAAISGPARDRPDYRADGDDGGFQAVVGTDLSRSFRGKGGAFRRFDQPGRSACHAARNDLCPGGRFSQHGGRSSESGARNRGLCARYRPVDLRGEPGGSRLRCHSRGPEVGTQNPDGIGPDLRKPQIGSSHRPGSEVAGRSGTDFFHNGKDGGTGTDGLALGC